MHTETFPVILERFVMNYPKQKRFGYELMPLYEAHVARDVYKIAKIGADHLKTEDFRRAYGAEAKRYATNIDSFDSVSVNRYTIESAVDRAELISAPNLAQASLLVREARLKNAYDKMMLSIEREQLKQILDPTLYGDHSFSPTETDLWSNVDSDPLAQIQDARLKIKLAIGLYPNKIVISDNVWQELRFKQNLIDKLPNTSLKAGLTPEEFGKLVDIKHVVIADTMYYDNDGLSYAWGDSVVLAYAPEQIYTLEDLSYGITIRCPLGYEEMRDYHDDRTTSDVTAIDERLGFKVINYQAGFLFHNVL